MRQQRDYMATIRRRAWQSPCRAVARVPHLGSILTGAKDPAKRQILLLKNAVAGAERAGAGRRRRRADGRRRGGVLFDAGVARVVSGSDGREDRRRS